MDKTYALEEMRKFYPHNPVMPSELGFEIHPNDYRQAREILIIPNTLPTIKDGNGDYVPLDLTYKWDDNVVRALLSALDMASYGDLYCAYCRFGIFWRDHDDRHILQIVNPSQATHIQLVGLRDLTTDGWMPQPNPIEERLDYIADTHYSIPLRATEEMLRCWILACDFKTEKLRHECSTRLASRSAIIL